jgi:DNA gyrase subunit A
MSDVVAPPPAAPPGPPNGPQEALVPVNIEDEMRASYLDYAMSVIIGRALPDVRDGLKPVHRRVLFAMQDLGNTYNRAYKKSARVVGDVIGKYHPHGDSAVYDSLVRMAQPFSLRHMLVDGQGNFGSIDGDHAAAMRYTEVRMTRLAAEMLADIDKDTVDFGPNYDESLSEPRVMPARFPNLLVNGSSGIAVGMATNIAPHNLGEVIDATLALIDDPTLGTAELMQHVPGPDFPTGGIVYGTSGLHQAYETGRGVIHVRGRATMEEGRRGERIVITEIPYQVNKTTLIEKIADLVRERRVEGIADIRDESDRDGMRIVIELKRDTHGEVVLNQLYSNTALQSSFGYNMLAIVGGQPQVLSLKAILEHFLEHRRDVVTRRSRFELSEAQKRFNVVFGLLAADDSIDRIIEIVRAAPDQAAAKSTLMAEPLPSSPAFVALCEQLITFPYPQGEQAARGQAVQLSEAQAQAILDMRLARLTGLERDKLGSEAQVLRDTIERLSAILASEARLMHVIAEELRAVRDAFSDPRRTELVADARQISVEDLIADEPMVVTVSHMGYVKRSPQDAYQAQNRGGRGRTAATTREQDFVDNMFVASTHAYLLIFTDRGRVFWLKVHKIPLAGRTSRGKPIVNFIRTETGERIAAVLPVKTFAEGQFIVMCTSAGTIKKTDLMAFSNPRPSGLIALSIEPGDRLTHVGLTDGDREILLATKDGLAVRFSERHVRAMGRSARGVRAITFKHEGDAVVGMVIIDAALPQLLTVCENGYGKRTDLSEYRCQARGGSGTINIRVGGRNGQVSGVCGVAPEDEVMVVTNRGMMIRFSVGQVSLIGRGGQGVRVMSLGESEGVAQVARIMEAPTSSTPLTELEAAALEEGGDAALPGDEDDGEGDVDACPVPTDEPGA